MNNNHGYFLKKKKKKTLFFTITVYNIHLMLYARYVCARNALKVVIK